MKRIHSGGGRRSESRAAGTVREGRGGFGLEAAETVGNAGEPGGAGGHGGLFKSIPTGSIPGHRCAEWRFGERAITCLIVHSPNRHSAHLCPGMDPVGIF